MRTLPTELQARLATGATTLAWCWRVARADGVVLGFTEHDRDLTFDGVVHRAASAAPAGDAESAAGFAAGAAAVAGVLDSAQITETDLAAGAYDAARIDLYRVDWTDVTLRAHLWSGRIGDVRRGETAFEAELRGLMADLERTIGRVIQRRCDAELGDTRCTVDLNLAQHRGAGVVTGLLDTRRLRASGLATFAAGYFARGRIEWTSGANAGRASEVDVHRTQGAEAVLELLIAPVAPIAVTDAFTAVAGCDKVWRTCRDKFANIVNFRGFPMMPGDDWAQRSVRTGDRHDGGSLWVDRDR